MLILSPQTYTAPETRLSRRESGVYNTYIERQRHEDDDRS
jgi:hypothetical protein